MRPGDPRLQAFTLPAEMRATPAAVRAFDPGAAAECAEAVRRKGRLLLVGEGSSRIFPGRQAIVSNLRRGAPVMVAAEGCRQALEYPLERWVVAAASRSGATLEVLDLLAELARRGHDATFTFGRMEEKAFPSTRSVVLEALWAEAALGRRPPLEEIAGAIAEVLDRPVAPAVLGPLERAATIHFAGRSDGVAEELVLKCVEIARKRAVYFEGTYAFHGPKAVLRAGAGDAVVLVDPFEREWGRLEELLVRRLGLPVVAIAPRETPFPTLVHPPAGEGGGPYVQLAAGWSLLVELGLALGTDLDGRDVQLS